MYSRIFACACLTPTSRPWSSCVVSYTRPHVHVTISPSDTECRTPHSQLTVIGISATGAV
jgi:hypothetical protein